MFKRSFLVFALLLFSASSFAFEEFQCDLSPGGTLKGGLNKIGGAFKWGFIRPNSGRYDLRVALRDAGSGKQFLRVALIDKNSSEGPYDGFGATVAEAEGSSADPVSLSLRDYMRDYRVECSAK